MATNSESSAPSDAKASSILANIVWQHADEAASRYVRRVVMSEGPGVSLHQLRRTDEGLAAHLDGLAVAGEHAWRFCDAALETPSTGAVFTATVRAIEERRQDRLERLFALTGAVPETRSGLTSAFGWLERKRLQGIVASLLESEDALKRTAGIIACSMHRVDPGIVSGRWLVDVSPVVRARAFRTAGEISYQEAVSACVAAIRDDDPDCRMWAAWSSVLMGNQGVALEALAARAFDPSPHQFRAFRLVLQAMNAGAAHRMLQKLATDSAQLRLLIQGSGIAGDSGYVPWLIKHMTGEKTARLAGEAFSLVTGIDLSQGGFEDNQPENFESGPNDDPDDPNVDMDPDDGLPWPDVDKIEKWWAANGSRFQKGTRYFMGAPVTRENCIDVLKNGYQRQRILAAHYLCLLEPGTPLFNTSAPAWRQQRLLAKMT